MSGVVSEIAERVKALAPAQMDEFLSWLVEYETDDADEWDAQIVADSAPGGRLGPVLARVRADIAAGRTVPLDEAIGHA
ncbi:MAG: hypothetical protein FJX72_12045 [Armatimonadetes bacterium]|nr:hypothetical protein [Armatimonadota bacterium]